MHTQSAAALKIVNKPGAYRHLRAVQAAIACALPRRHVHAAQAAGGRVERRARRQRVPQRSRGRRRIGWLADLRRAARRGEALVLVNTVDVAAVQQQDAPAAEARRKVMFSFTRTLSPY